MCRKQYIYNVIKLLWGGKNTQFQSFFGSFYFLTNQGLYKTNKNKTTKIKFVPTVGIAYHAGSPNYMQNNMTNNNNMKKQEGNKNKKRKVGIKTVSIKGLFP